MNSFWYLSQLKLKQGLFKLLFSGSASSYCEGSGHKTTLEQYKFNWAHGDSRQCLMPVVSCKLVRNADLEIPQSTQACTRENGRGRLSGFLTSASFFIFHLVSAFGKYLFCLSNWVGEYVLSYDMFRWWPLWIHSKLYYTFAFYIMVQLWHYNFVHWILFASLMQMHSQKKRYKSCHWGCTFSKGTLLYLKGAYWYFNGTY